MIMPKPRRGVELWLTVLLLGGMTAGRHAPDIELAFLPVQPRPGSFVQLTVSSRSTLLTSLRGTLAGQPVLFERDSLGSWLGLAGIPVSATDSIPLTLNLEGVDGAAVDTVVYLPVHIANFLVEKLTVAPRFSARPDSALAARVQREIARAAEISTAALTTPRMWTAPFARPRSTRITSRYGTGREFNGEIQSRHLGVDLAGTTGEIVRAPNNGVVALVDRFYYGGNVVYLNHGGGLVTAYMHLSEALVAIGDTVRQGTPIGRVGATGRVTAAHLHWIARYGSVTLDPLSLEGLPLEVFGAPPGRPLH
jgi:murein DD-endopeptidase MepM/ murein hydrolase activator NlpD